MTTPLPTPWPEGTYSDDLLALLDEPNLTKGDGGPNLSARLRRCAAEAMHLVAATWRSDTVDLEPLQYRVACMAYFVRLTPEMVPVASVPMAVLVALRQLAKSPPERQAQATILAEQAEALLSVFDVARRAEAIRAKETAHVTFVPIVITDPTLHVANEMLGWLKMLPSDTHRWRARQLLRELLTNDERHWKRQEEDEGVTS